MARLPWLPALPHLLHPCLRVPHGRALLATTTAACLGLLLPAAPVLAASPATASATTAAADGGVAWVQAGSDAEVDAAFARARAENKPLFLYWGASWCPPCNQLSATLFNRQDFIARSRAFVPVYIDGDRPGAQKLGARFQARAYPTMLLFRPDGTELTRLPGEVDPAQYTQVLTLGMGAQRPVKAILADALAGAAKAAALGAGDWRLLAFYAWDTDMSMPAEAAGRPLLPLARQAAASRRAPAEVVDRLWLKALAAAGEPAQAAPLADPQGLRRLDAVLAQPAQARQLMDVLTNQAPALVRAVSPAEGPARAALVQRFDRVLQGLAQDTGLSRADRLTALLARVELQRLVLPAGSPLPAALLETVRSAVAHEERTLRNGYERQAVVATAAYLLRQAGLGTESDRLLQDNLARSQSPYYLMSALAGNAKARGDLAAALRWHEQAFVRSEGAATRLQWGAALVSALTEITPQDTARIEQTVQRLFDEAAAQPDVFHERSARSLQRVGQALLAWQKRAPEASGAALLRLQSRLDGLCRGLPAGDTQRGQCERLLQPAA